MQDEDRATATSNSKHAWKSVSKHSIDGDNSSVNHQSTSES